MPTRPPGTPDLDLTTADSFGEINGGLFMVGALQPAGTGTFNSFLRIQDNGIEEGYNSDGSAQYDEKASHTNAVLLADIPIVFGDGSGGTVDGVAYREFLLDLNEPNGGTSPYLSLDSLQLWQEEAGNLTGFTPGSGFAGTHTNYLAYDLDAGGDKWIALTDGNGGGQSNYRILIPDSFFINDAAHRYVTLYSKFGVQAGWNANGGFEEWGLANSSGGPRSALAVSKTATVPGGTADTVGEVITYNINVSNVGNTTLTGLTVTDPSVSDLTAVTSGGFNTGDVDHDNVFDGGEMWQFIAHHTVTQADIDFGGTTGDGTITNTVTADTTETAAVSATSVIAVEQSRSIEVTKMADVSSADEAGDVINYTVNVTNTGTVTLSGLIVTDPQYTVVTPILDLESPILGATPLLGPILVGDYNIGDTNENGVEDPGETFQYANIGDENQNGIEDPGETFEFANIGDTNGNGVEDPGETFQYYNAGDTNQNGIEDPGETFQVLVSHVITDVDADDNGQNDGDTNLNGQLDVGETWSYTVSYTVTQDDIDNGGVVDPGLTHDNTATGVTAEGIEGSASVSVGIVQNPHLTLTKSGTVADGTADEVGDVINYTINILNDGNMTLTGLSVTDPSVGDLAGVESGGFNVGDADTDGKLDLGETWQYTASYTITQDDIDNGGVVDPALSHDNIATATTDQAAADADASDSDDESIAVVQNPHLTLTKSGTVADGDADEVGDVINYTINVLNDGNMTLTGLSVTDPSVSDLAGVMSGSFNAGDADSDGNLDAGETWQYTASYTITQADIDNGGVVDPGLSHDNTATATTDQAAADADASDSDDESIPIVQSPSITVAKDATVPGGTADTAGEVIAYTVGVTNNGNMSLTGVTVSDPFVSNLAAIENLGFNVGDTNSDGQLSVGETWQYSASHTVTQAEIDNNGGGDGFIDNTASVTTDQGANASDGASIEVEQPAVAALFLDKSDAVGTHFVDNDEDGRSDVGDDLIQYAFQITNTGTLVLHDVTINDPLFGGLIYGPEVLDPGETFTFSLNHFLTQADVDAGHVANTATASALDPSNNLITIMAHYDQVIPPP